MDMLKRPASQIGGVTTYPLGDIFAMVKATGVTMALFSELF
ncbi:hypothetical protein [Sedimentitalea todarodis]|uniref:Uncharacterized protein n=1 Tax=Sedimentitalea todarodis TaxID=1631240 RepID=A0ABU3VG15_9RHOB|nr:hypothetical protein [Sedimentitalea todarodis]MDU9005121.1 hypothetical protein [Sedimentitalea todarodis]